MFPAQGGMYGPPMYGMPYGYDPRVGEAGSSRGGRAEAREPAPVKFTEGKLFIGGVEHNLISKDELVEYCSQWGKVADAVIMERKGYGFVTFADTKSAMEFLEKREHELKGRRLDAKAAVPKAHLGTAKLTRKMFVGGTGELTDQDFVEHFSQFGEIEDAAVVRREGQSRGFGFVTFKDEMSVEKCLVVNHYIKGRKVELKRAVPKDEAGQQQQQQAPQAMYGYPPGPYSPQPGMMQQQFYPMGPYGAPAGPYGMPRPAGFPPPNPAAGMPPPMGADPYAGWYGMHGYGMPPPYGMGYPAAAGMYPPPHPYGMMPHQPGMGAGPYGGAHPYMTPGAGRMQQQQSGAGGGGAEAGGGSSAGGARGPRGGNNRGGGAGAGGGSAQQQHHPQQQQQHDPHAASPSGPASSPDPRGGMPPGVEAASEQQQQQQASGRRAAADPAAAAAAAGGSSGQQQQPPGIPQAGSSGSAAGASSPGASRQGRSPVVVSYPSLGVRSGGGGGGPQQRAAMGPGAMQYAAAAAAGGGGGAGGAPPGSMPPGFGAGPGVRGQQQQQAGARSTQQQQPNQQ